VEEQVQDLADNGCLGLVSRKDVVVVGPDPHSTSTRAWEGKDPSSFRVSSSRCNHSPTGRAVEVPDGDSIGFWATSGD
jgi:hypothetical protein